MPSDHDSQSGCSTIESPRHDIVDDYLSNGSTSDHAQSSDNEFSTDVSSTRKRRKYTWIRARYPTPKGVVLSRYKRSTRHNR